jgi:2-hydroxyacyl-CoA lyase 1
MDGAGVVARALKELGVEYMFGIVGRPVTNIAMMAQAEGIKYYSFRNEQAASYAAGAIGYLTGKPGVCLCVSGPGVVHALAGVGNAWSNHWPMLLLGGASPTENNEMGGFQEAPQIETVRPYVKLAARIESIDRVPFYIEKAYRAAFYGRPGATYLDIPAEVIYDRIDESKLHFPGVCPPPPLTYADPQGVAEALRLLKSAHNPLVIIGKGAAYARAENEIKQFVEKTGFPFLPTPMGKGVMPDDHGQGVSAARTFALQNADVVLLIGARLNWILHFGLPPRWRKDVKIIQIDIAGDEMHNNIRNAVSLIGDARAVMSQFNQLLQTDSAHRNFSFGKSNDWWKQLDARISKNRKISENLYVEDKLPMTYYRALKGVQDTLPKDAIIVSEGANTMDIGRTILDNSLPRHRLDAGTWGTMGVGLGFAIAAALVHPDKRVVAVEGDSAFGFSGMEIETACRYNIPLTIVIINNNGISMGLETISGFDKTNVPFFVYTPQAHYEKIADMFGGKGYFVTRPEEIEPAMKDALSQNCVTIVNIMIDTSAKRKEQEFPFELTKVPTSKSNL